MLENTSKRKGHTRKHHYAMYKIIWPPNPYLKYCMQSCHLFKIGCGNMERGSEKGDKDDHKKTMAPEKKNHCKK